MKNVCLHFENEGDWYRQGLKKLWHLAFLPFPARMPRFLKHDQYSNLLLPIVGKGSPLTCENDRILLKEQRIVDLYIKEIYMEGFITMGPSIISPAYCESVGITAQHRPLSLLIFWAFAISQSLILSFIAC